MEQNPKGVLLAALLERLLPVHSCKLVRFHILRTGMPKQVLFARLSWCQPNKSCLHFGSCWDRRSFKNGPDNSGACLDKPAANLQNFFRWLKWSPDIPIHSHTLLNSEKSCTPRWTRVNVGPILFKAGLNLCVWSARWWVQPQPPQIATKRTPVCVTMCGFSSHLKVGGGCCPRFGCFLPPGGGSTGGGWLYMSGGFSQGGLRWACNPIFPFCQPFCRGADRSMRIVRGSIPKQGLVREYH